MAGQYTEIVEIVAPETAGAGEQVSIVVRVKNLGSYAFYIAATAVFDATQFPVSPEYATVGAGQVQSFSGSFIMPSNAVRVTVWSWYWTGSEWHLDDERSVDIALAQLAPEFSQLEIADYRAV